MSYEELQFDDLAQGYAADAVTAEELRKGNVAQVIALRVHSHEAAVDEDALPVLSSRPPPSYGLLLSNTHLQWNPHYRFVRLKQCERLLQVMADTRQRLPGIFHRVSCGDFNVTPTTSIYSFLSQGAIDPSLWSRFATPVLSPQSAGDSDEAAPPPGSKARDELAEAAEDITSSAAFQQRMDEVRRVLEKRAEWPLLQSAYASYTDIVPDDIRPSVLASGAQEWSGWTGEPPFTHFVDRYRGTLDYIFTAVESGEEGKEGEQGGVSGSELRVVSVMELPTEEAVSVQTALPNDVLGSDHVCIGCQLLLTIPADAPDEGVNEGYSGVGVVDDRQR